MPFTLGWYDIASRLLLTFIAGALLGLNRTERGRAAGLRTTILVCLAASVAMIQTNLLIPTTGKTPDSFVTFDLMRLPLGILTGMGFIGGGAILRRGDMVQGVTTAATLWLTTVIGLCLGGGQFGLGSATLAISLVVLWGLKHFEVMIPQNRYASLRLSMVADGSREDELRAMLLRAGYRIDLWDVTYKTREDTRLCLIHCRVHWFGQSSDNQMPAFLTGFKQHPDVLAIRWKA